MKSLWYILIVIFVISCKDGGEQQNVVEPERVNNSEEEESDKTENDQKQKTDWQSYTSQKWHFSLEFPEGFVVYEGNLPGKTPVVNLYDVENDSQPPFAIHEPASASYISFLPHGFGVDGPSSTRKSLAEWDGDLPLSFTVNPLESTVYLLENGTPWAVNLNFNSPPPDWNQYGSIFVHYPVQNFRTECVNEAGETIPTEKCDPLEGDSMKYFGKVPAEKRENINAILSSLEFLDPENERQKISDLIKVKKPAKNAEINSPFTIEGEARGQWFFEGQAPYELVDGNHKTLARGSVKAEGRWMTEDFVPFKAEVSFEAPKTKSGTLILKRDNASGKPEHDRVMRIPVKF